MTTTTSKYTEGVTRAIEETTHEGLLETLKEARDVIEDDRIKADRLVSEVGTPKARKEAKLRRMRATRLESGIVMVTDYSNGRGEWAPGGKYATPEYLARRAESKKVSA